MSLIFLSVLFSGHQITTFAAPQSRSRPVVRTAQCSHPDGRCCQSKVLTCSSGAMQHYKAKAPQDTSMLSQSQQRSYLSFSILPEGTLTCSWSWVSTQRPFYWWLTRSISWATAAQKRWCSPPPSSNHQEGISLRKLAFISLIPQTVSAKTTEVGPESIGDPSPY